MNKVINLILPKSYESHISSTKKLGDVIDIEVLISY
jgi:hypothetical protein